MGRFIVETHCHAQRHAARIQPEGDDPDYGKLADKMETAVPADEADDDADVIVYSNADRLKYDMDTYDVDMCVLLPAFGMTNEINHQIMQEDPDKFISAAYPVQTKKRALRGEEEWSWDAACEELDEWLSKDGFKMIGEGVPLDPTIDERVEWPERRDEIRRVFEVADDHDVPVRWHTGYVSGYGGGGLFEYFPDWSDPTLAGEIKAEFDDVPIIFDHGGMQATWREKYVDDCCQVAATYDDVYLEIGLYWKDLMKKPMNDPNISIEQILWGGDWGASMIEHNQPGEEPPMFWDQITEKGLPAHQVDYWGSNLRQLWKYATETDLPQDDLDLILGGNAVRLFDLEMPHTRMFPEYIDT
ncbi:amidohydrolase family protein [Natrarchaeobius versutus]|uniref:amidohydrolase family protein n=1 Tax=Natrarchaeobius versutus TaxID=1679078 RepID=UPI00350EE55A